jgi:hypothetical protein
MLARVDPDDRSHALANTAVGDARDPIVTPVGDADHDAGTLLPRDHPKWARDSLTVSQRARDLIARLKPVAVAILTFWDHQRRAAIVAGSRLCIDASGSYRLE